jgi:hypothetical protein
VTWERFPWDRACGEEDERKGPYRRSSRGPRNGRVLTPRPAIFGGSSSGQEPLVGVDVAHRRVRDGRSLSASMKRGVVASSAEDDPGE